MRTNSSGPCRRQRCGWTLVEMLVAVVIGGGVVSTAATVSVQSFTARKSVQAKLEKRWSREQVLQAFEQDVASRLLAVSSETGSVAPMTEPGGLVEINCLTTTVDVQAEFPRFLPAVVRWRLTSAEQTGDVRVIRDVRFLMDPPEKVSRTVLGPPVHSARVEYLAGDQWTSDPKSINRKRTVRAVRLALQWNESGDRQVRTVLLDADKADREES